MSSMTPEDVHTALRLLRQAERDELDNAHRLHGGAHLPMNMGPASAPLAGLLPGSTLYQLTAAQLRDAAQEACQASAEAGTLSWRSVLLEEVFELLAEDPLTDTVAWVTEALQVRAVIARMLTDTLMNGPMA